jgi:dihydropteroate synthase
MLTVSQFLRSRRPLIMGILNVTPDSFSDGGDYFGNVRRAVARIKEMLNAGADVIDIGGESTRPGARAVSAAVEMGRVLPVIKAVRRALGRSPLLSIDTYKAEVAAAAIEAGANLVNSVGGFTFDNKLAAVVAKAHCPIVIYHIKGEPRTMQQGAIRYRDVIKEISQFFKQQMSVGRQAGVRPEEAVHVGDDTLLDVAGARRSGMRVIQVTAETPAAGALGPDGVIAGFDELPAALDRLPV